MSEQELAWTLVLATVLALALALAALAFEKALLFLGSALELELVPSMLALSALALVLQLPQFQ